jgi:CBS-domain-containing membrane protein
MVVKEEKDGKGLRVADLRHLLSVKPSVVTPDQPIRKLLQCFVKNRQTRHVYVVDSTGKMTGSVRLNDMVSYLFPDESADTAANIGEMLRILSADSVGDIVRKDFRWVCDSTPLDELVQIMSDEQLNELPVVDEKMQLLGEINMLEVIMAWIEGDRD